MDPTRTPESAVAIVAGGALTTLGRGTEPLAVALVANSSGLAPCAEWNHQRYQTAVVGAVSESLLEPCPSGVSEDALAFRWADDVLSQAKNPSTAAAWAVAPERRGLVVSTTKADVRALENLVAGRRISAMARRHIRPGLFTLDLAQAHEVRGPLRCVNAACVSGLLAIQQAVSLIRRGLADTVAVVGVDMASHLVLMGFTKLQALAPEGCRPFDRDRVGLSLGEGAGALIFSRPERLPRASFVVSGGGSSNDANHLTGPSRDGSGLALAIEAALRAAGRDPSAVDYAHVHGTGTPYNDNMEALALRRVFGDHAPPFSGSKGMLGHTLAAAGILETLLCLLAADQQLLPGTPRLIHPDPVAPRSLISQPRRADRMQCLLKTNCGFAGTNAAIVLERIPRTSTSPAGHCEPDLSEGGRQR